MNKRMRATAARVSVGSASMRTYKVGTPMNTLARAMSAITRLGSNLACHSMGLPFSSAPCKATNKPCTWKMGKAWISTSPGTQPQ